MDLSPDRLAGAWTPEYESFALPGRESRVAAACIVMPGHFDLPPERRKQDRDFAEEGLAAQMTRFIVREGLMHFEIEPEGQDQYYDEMGARMTGTLRVSNPSPLPAPYRLVDGVRWVGSNDYEIQEHAIQAARRSAFTERIATIANEQRHTKAADAHEWMLRAKDLSTQLERAKARIAELEDER